MENSIRKKYTFEKRYEKSGGSGKLQEVKIWSLTTRFFHWSLVLLILLASLTSSSDFLLSIHTFVGFLSFALVLWRAYYGFFGPFYSRFKIFLVSPEKLLTHMKKTLRLNPPEYTGHNPPAGWMTLAFLITVALIFLTGIFTLSGEENQGLLWRYIPVSTGEFFKDLHEGLAALMGVMVFIHLCGIVIDSFLHKTNLIKSMITGRKKLGRVSSEGRMDMSECSDHSLKALSLLCVSLLVLGSLYHKTSSIKQGMVDLKEAGVSWKLWKEECSGCHELFHPSLLPKRSWVKMTDQLGAHFGDDASLEEEDRVKITQFLIHYAAEQSNTEAAYKISRSIGPFESPIRITAAPYWVKKHKMIGGDVYKKEAVKSKSNCSSCHLDALSGGYEDAMIRIP